MQFTYRIEYDNDYTPWGEPEIIAEETAKIFHHVWAAYGLVVSAVGPVEAEESVWGCVVPLTATGTFTELDKIEDAHLRDTAAVLASEIEARYLQELYRKRDEINAAIQSLEGK